MKEAAITPFEIEHVDVPTAFPDTEQVTSAVEKPNPVISIIEPATAELGLIVIDGAVSVGVVVWLTVLVVAAVEVELVVVCIGVEVVVIVWLDVVKSTLMFVPVSVIVLVIGPNPGPEAVTVMVPEVPIGIA
jgi:hypothetical protein